MKINSQVGKVLGVSLLFVGGNSQASISEDLNVQSPSYLILKSKEFVSNDALNASYLVSYFNKRGYNVGLSQDVRATDKIILQKVNVGSSDKDQTLVEIKNELKALVGKEVSIKIKNIDQIKLAQQWEIFRP